MAVDGNGVGEVSACGRENIGIDLGFRDDVTGASVSISVSVSEEEEEVDILSEGEDIMVGVSGADIFFDGIYGPEGQEEDEEDVGVVREDEDEFNDYEIHIDETLEIKDYGVCEVQETPAGGVESSDKIVSCVRALVQSLPMPGQISPEELADSFTLPGQISPQELVPSFPLPGQISPQELVPVGKLQSLSSDHSLKESKYGGINQRFSSVPKRKRERIDVKPKECGTSGKKHADVIFYSPMLSRFQEFEEFLNATAKHPNAQDNTVSQLQMAAQAGEGDCNQNFEKQHSEKGKMGLPGHSACDSSLLTPVKDIKDSYWTDMVIQTESPANLPTVNTLRGSKAYKSVSTRLRADVPNKRLRMKTLDYNHVPVAATTDKSSPAELILTFDHIQAIPSESKLYNIFRRFGSLIETETLIYYESCCARVVFKKSSEAEVAVNSAKAFNIMGPSVVKYELRYTPLSAASVMQVAESEAINEYELEVMNAGEVEPELMNAGEVEPDMMNAPEAECEEMPVQQMQFEHFEETSAAGITLEIEELEGLDDVDIME